MAEAKASKRLFAEFFLIFVSILAAFGVEEFREERARNQLKELALSNIRAEVESNLEALDAVMPYHREIAGEVQIFLSDESNWRGMSGFQAGATVAPRGVLRPDLRRTAWETANATGAVALFDYDLSQTIARVYDDQGEGVDATIQRLVDHMFTPAMFRSDDTEATLLLLGAMAGELYAQEHQLRQTFERMLEEIG